MICNVDYVVLSYNDNNGKRRVKYFSTGLPEKGNKRKAEAELLRIRSEFEPPNEVGELAADMLFTGKGKVRSQIGIKSVFWYSVYFIMNTKQYKGIVCPFLI